LFQSHFLTLTVFSALVSAFFATLTRETPREALKVGSLMMSLMVGISLAVAYLMYFFPST
jgi:hypothetical protein